jgi:hypothetical protein
LKNNKKKEYTELGLAMPGKYSKYHRFKIVSPAEDGSKH